MVREKYGVRLTPEQRNRLQHLVRAGKESARVTIRARILLKTDEGWSAPRVAQALDMAEGTVFRFVVSPGRSGPVSGPLDRPGRPLSWRTWLGWPLRRRSAVGRGAVAPATAPPPTAKRPLGQTRPEAANAWKA